MFILWQEFKLQKNLVKRVCNFFIKIITFLLFGLYIVMNIDQVTKEDDVLYHIQNNKFN